MSIISTYSLSGDNFLMDNNDLSSDFSFEDIKTTHLSSKTVISTLSTTCKLIKYNILLFNIIFYYYFYNI